MKLAAATALAVSLALPAWAQAPCMPLDAAEAQLRDKYGESPRFQGLAEGMGALVMVWLNELTGTWTLLIVKPDGTACLVGEGQGGAIAAAEAAGDPA